MRMLETQSRSSQSIASPRRHHSVADDIRRDGEPNARLVALAHYVVPFDGSGRYQISTNGGEFPRWARDGSELFFLSLSRELISVPVKAGAAGFEFGPPKSLFVPLASTATSGWIPYDVSPDGQRFLVSRPTESTFPSSITVVMDGVPSLKH